MLFRYFLVVFSFLIFTNILFSQEQDSTAILQDPLMVSPDSLISPAIQDSLRVDQDSLTPPQEGILNRAEDAINAVQDSTSVEDDAFGNVSTLLWPFMEVRRVKDSLDIEHPVTYWTNKNQFGLEINEVAFMNWSSGGSNSISFLFNSHLMRTYERKSIRWKNELISRYGILSEKGQKLRKTDDRLEMNSTFGYRASETSAWFMSGKMNFKTQFANGYEYPDRSKAISRFMAPGYLFLGVGAELGRDSNSFSLYISPSTIKTTFVLDSQLANEGAFGVRGAEYDGNGNIIRSGRRTNTEFGILLSNEYNTEIVENILFSNRLNLYTDYLHDFGNIDVDWEIEFNFKVNEYVRAKLGSHLKYDDATKTARIDPQGNEYQGGAKVQWKQQIGIGVVVNL